MRATMIRLCACVALLASPAVPRRVLVGQQPAEQSLKGLRTAANLEVTLWASEPDLSNPTNIAIDERGRVWVLEGVNYRRQLRGQPDLRPEGDRIVILEDTDGDGKADRSKVFDQSPQIRAPLGIAVLGNRVIVSQSPDLVVYTKDESDRIVSREVLLTGWSGVDHDHGLHAVVYGPDGRYYFNAGNEGFDVTDRSGRRLRSPKPAGPGAAASARDAESFLEGAAMMVDPDGKNLRVLAQNFRNPYEIAIDAFGDLWQTDNDDDGNAWTRASYVMEGGNYGFRGPYGRTWREDLGSHFHEELPGVVPNLLRLGPGSPCGLAVYEGTLLPQAYRGQLLHAEAGRRVIAHYPLTLDGAGFKTRIDEIVFGGGDTWFRPSDVAVAPDGAVYISDWYDPSVGGHGMGDTQGGRGRIYRLAPPRHRARVPAVNLQTRDGLVAAFRSPAQAVYFLARAEIARQGDGAIPLLEQLWAQGDPVLKARALWMLGERGAAGRRRVEDALRSADPRLRVLALRVLRQNGADMLAVARPLVKDPSPQVRRELALMLQDPARMTPAYAVGAQATPPAALLDALVDLTAQYDGKDRWYLAALGIAARGREDALYARLRDIHPEGTAAFWQLLREWRAPASLSHLSTLVRDRTRPEPERMQALDVIAVMPSLDAAAVVETIVTSGDTPAPLAAKAFAHLRHQLFSLWTDARKSPTLPAAVRKGLATKELEAVAVELASALGDPQYGANLMVLAKSASADPSVRAAAVDAVAANREPGRLTDFADLLESGPPAVRVSAIHAIGLLAPPDLDVRAEAVVLGDAPNDARAEAVRILARSTPGLTRLTGLKASGKFPPELDRVATSLVHGPVRGGFGPPARPGSPSVATDQNAEVAAYAAARQAAANAFPPLVALNDAAVPTIRQMEQSFHADPAAGRTVFQSLCSTCHALGGARQMGPDLSAIGTKLDRQALLDAIVMPSAAIAFGYESWTLETSARGVVTGLLVEDTPDRVVLKVDATQEIRLAPSEIKARRAVPVSSMPEGLVNAMTPQQIVDLVGFLTTLQAPTPAASR